MTDTTLPEPWELYPMPPEEKAAIRRYIRRMTKPAVWRVQWHSRRDFGEPDRPEGFRDYHSDTAEADARDYLASDAVQSRVGAFWRVELQCRGPWVTVESGSYTEEDR